MRGKYVLAADHDRVQPVRLDAAKHEVHGADVRIVETSFRGCRKVGDRIELDSIEQLAVDLVLQRESHWQLDGRESAFDVRAPGVPTVEILQHPIVFVLAFWPGD